MTIREELERREREILAPAAAKSADSKGRLRPEPEDPIRPVVPARSRSHHSHQGVSPAEAQDAGVLFAGRRSLSDAAHAHARGRADRAHDRQGAAAARGADRSHRARPRSRAHAVRPRRRAGASALVPGGFNHYEQSLRIVDVLENDRQGLNLTWEVRDGIARHSKGKSGLPVGAPPEHRASTIEGQVARVADIIAYVNHDFDDAVRAGLLTVSQSAGGASADVLGRSLVRAHRHDGQRRRPRNAGRRPDRDPDERRRAGGDARAAQLPVRRRSTRTRSRRPSSARRRASSAACGRRFGERPAEFLDQRTIEAEGLDVAAQDFVAGMTDRYAVSLYEQLFIPKPWVEINA